ncbi:hypothetical protein AeNC1_000157 [Aphanomyces euteiches]|nr:hypothetical protein AeNC1_000157 [Aphanomyces euteiches]
MQRRRKLSKAKESPESSETEAPVAAETKQSAVVLGVYSQTLYPSIPGGDSGELVAESCHLGVSHPPGYPIFNMINYLVVNIPGSAPKAWKANLFSAACDTGCSMLIYTMILNWQDSAISEKWLTKTAAATASVAFAWSPLIWTYAVGAEVFAMNNLFAALLLWTLQEYAQHRSWSSVCRGAFFSGLALCNQHTIVLFEVPIILWVLWTSRRELTLNRLGQLALFFLLGLLPYAYMPLTSYWNPQPGSWGDVTSFYGFFHHLRRGDYGTFRLFATDRETESLQERLVFYFKDAIVREGGYILCPLALVGIFQRPRTLGKSLASLGYIILFVYVFYLVVFHSLSNMPLTEGLLYGVHMRFWQQPNIILFLWGGIGLSTILRRLHRASKTLGVLGALVAISAAIAQGAFWYPLMNQSEAWYIHNYAKALLDPLPEGALLFVNYDLQWTSIRYLQRCEHFRTDLTVLNLSMMTYEWFAKKHALYPQLSFPGTRLVASVATDKHGFTIRELIQANIKLFPSGIYLGGQLNFPDPTLHEHFILVPHGLLDEFHPTDKRLYKSLKTWYRHYKQNLAKVNFHLSSLPSTELYNDETWEWTVARDYHMKQLSAATFLLDETIKGSGNITYLAECAKPLEHSLLNEPRQFWSESLLKNLGLAYAYIVRSADDFPVDGPDPFLPHVGRNIADKTKWKDRASERMLEVWRQWIALPSARSDPGYAAIADIVGKFTK